jgi:tetratricopeptide (TPR) repeat protein
MFIRFYLMRILILGFFLFPTVLFGAETIVSTQSNPLDGTNPFARSAAMGSAFVGVADDASALFINPAGLAFLKQGELFMNSDFWLVDTFQETILLGIPAAPMGGLAIAGEYLNFGNFVGRDDSGSLTNSYGADRLNLQAGWGFEVFRGLALGLSVQGQQTTLAGVAGSDLSSNLSLLWSPFAQFKLGAAYDHFGVFSSASPESEMILGSSYQINFDDHQTLLTAVSGTIGLNSVNYLQAGFEYGLQHCFFVRAGYQDSLQDSGLQGLSGLTAGLGVVFSDLSFDYAYLPYGGLGTSHQISVGYRFDTISPIPSPTPSVTPQPQTGNSSLGSNSLTVQFDIPSDATNAGQDLEKQGKYKEAVTLYEQAIQENPNDASAWTALGNLYVRTHQKIYAIRCFEQVLQIEPDHQKLSDWLKQYENQKP